MSDREWIQAAFRSYMTMQDHRERAQQQFDKIGFPLFERMRETFAAVEKEIKRELAAWCKTDHMATWSMAHVGIAEINAAGLSAYIDIEQAPTVGHIWRFAGLDGPRSKSKRGEKRYWCADFKKLCAFYIGESFVKVCNNPNAVYGHLYKDRKLFEQGKNERGEYAEQAAAKAPTVGKSTIAFKHYSTGHLPPAHIHARARAYAVKQFLADWHAEAYRTHFGKEPPLPYPIAILGHAHQRARELEGTKARERAKVSESTSAR